MRQHRRIETTRLYEPDGSHLKLDGYYWHKAAARDRLALCNVTFFDQVAPDRLQFSFLATPVQIDFESRRLMRESNGAWQPSEDPLLEMATVLYLAEVRELFPIGRDIVGVRDLKEGHFFTGPHELQLDQPLERFGENLKDFQACALRLGGEPMQMADAAFRLLPFPRLPLYYLLWQGDAEFKPRIQVLLERPIETILAADAIWALINRVSQAFMEV